VGIDSFPICFLVRSLSLLKAMGPRKEKRSFPLTFPQRRLEGMKSSSGEDSVQNDPRHAEESLHPPWRLPFGLL